MTSINNLPNELLLDIIERLIGDIMKTPITEIYNKLQDIHNLMMTNKNINHIVKEVLEKIIIKNILNFSTNKPKHLYRLEVSQAETWIDFSRQIKVELNHKFISTFKHLSILYDYKYFFHNHRKYLDFSKKMFDFTFQECCRILKNKEKYSSNYYRDKDFKETQLKYGFEFKPSSVVCYTGSPFIKFQAVKEYLSKKTFKYSIPKKAKCLSKLKNDDLKKIVKTLGAKNYSSLNKAELIHRILELNDKTYYHTY
jgi:hypothetical protein